MVRSTDPNTTIADGWDFKHKDALLLGHCLALTNIYYGPFFLCHGKFLQRAVYNTHKHIVQEPVIGLIKWLRPKGLKVFSYVEKCAEFKNQTLKKNRLVHKSAMRNGIPPGCAISQNSAKMGVPLQVNTLNHVISVVKRKFWQQTKYDDQSLI